MQKGSKVVDDKTLRNSIINRYGFVDHEDDHKEHRPVAPKWVSYFFFFKSFVLNCYDDDIIY